MAGHVERTTKQEKVTRLISTLKSDIREGSLSSSDRLATLSQLKDCVRTAEVGVPLFAKESIQVLCEQSFDQRFLASSREALKCVANVLLLDSKTRQIFVDLGYAKAAVQRLKTNNREDELLASRILFLLTYGSNLNFDDLFNLYDLAKIINANIGRYSEQYSHSSYQNSLPLIDVQALSESLKLLFNLIQYYPHHISSFSDSIPHILNILLNHDLSSPPLQAPTTYLINSLLNLDLENPSSNPLFPASDQNVHVDRLIFVLSVSVRAYTDEELESSAQPLLTVLRRIHSIAPIPVKNHLRASLLPSNAERTQPLGQTDTLPSRLLRISTSPSAPDLRENTSTMLFELSDQDAATFVRNVGYGFASGFLLTHHLPVPRIGSVASSEGGDRGAMVTSVDGQEINPVTGQRRDMEPVDHRPAMTDEEKEREAERLFVLFERLKATGVIDVANPVEQAIQEGRFEEMD